MGEFAEDAIDCALENMLEGDNPDEEGEPFIIPSKTCKYCRTSGLYWHQTDRGWRLFDAEGKLHSCRRKK